MRVILDTNVFVSGVFFGGQPGKILTAWRNGKIRLFLSPEILEEYVVIRCQSTLAFKCSIS
jgi:putative PIN family toxin of toxin-antitoxin system